MTDLRTQPGSFMSKALLPAPPPPVVLLTVAGPACPSRNGELPESGCPWSPILAARGSHCPPPPTLCHLFCSPPSCAATCRLQDVLWLPVASPIKSKCLGQFSKVPLTAQPHLSLFPNTRSAPAKLIRLLSPRPCCRTGHFPHSWPSFPHLCCSVHFHKTPDQNWAFSTGTPARAWFFTLSGSPGSL